MRREEPAPCLVRCSPSWSSSSPCCSRRPPPAPAGRHRALHPAAGQLRRAADDRRLARPAPAVRRAHAAARERHRAATSTTSSCPRTSRRSAQTREEQTGRPGLTLIYDDYGVPHVYGKTRADVAFGAGWTTARDRGLLIQLGRGPARVAVADVPGINAFGLVTSAQSFVPSPEAEALVTTQKDLLVKTYGDKGRQILARRPGLRRRRQRLLEGQQHQPAAGHGQRRDRRDRLHRLDLRSRRRRRGDQLRAARPSSSRVSARCAATRPGTT